VLCSVSVDSLLEVDLQLEIMDLELGTVGVLRYQLDGDDEAMALGRITMENRAMHCTWRSTNAIIVPLPGCDAMSLLYNTTYNL